MILNYSLNLLQRNILIALTTLFTTKQYETFSHSLTTNCRQSYYDLLLFCGVFKLEIVLAIPASKLQVYDCLQYGGDINYTICGRYNVKTSFATHQWFVMSMLFLRVFMVTTIMMWFRHADQHHAGQEEQLNLCLHHSVNIQLYIHKSYVIMTFFIRIYFSYTIHIQYQKYIPQIVLCISNNTCILPHCTDNNKWLGIYIRYNKYTLIYRKLD